MIPTCTSTPASFSDSLCIIVRFFVVYLHATTRLTDSPNTPRSMAADIYVPAKVPTAGQVLSVILQMSTFGVLSICIMRRTQYIKKWTSLPLAIWLILIIYFDSALFVFTTAIVVHGLGINNSSMICEGGILLCLVCYMTTKILIYYFLVERAYIVRGSMKPRMRTKLWLFNCLVMLLPYAVFVILNFVFRITYINEKGVCIIGMQKVAMLPLIIFDVILNVYLTLLFVLPLRGLYSYKRNTNPTLKRMAFRSFVGSCATLITSVVNLSVLMVLHGEPGWICLMCCNADILFCVIVLHWVTSKDKISTSTVHNTPNNASLRSGTNLALASTRNSTAAEAKDAKDSKRASLALYPFTLATKPDAPKAQKLTGTIVTECRSDGVGAQRLKPAGRNPLHRMISADSVLRDGSPYGDEVELHSIRVNTEQTRQVEVEGEVESGDLGERGGDCRGEDGMTGRWELVCVCCTNLAFVAFVFLF
ncbi:hypothetical protein IQ07DRAFT_198741 [Pyrenochaeta sp. DS3sAY3a]|nr:hypothetical protein IQ07DRAFT_198741 [Pyrenochaeta sp. DS3sAY3a]